MATTLPKTLYLIANAHLDPVWLWRWPEGCTEIRSTCHAVVDFLGNDPALKFSRSSAGDMRWLVEMEPELLQRIRQLAIEGRWENVGGWWTQPDCNIPSGESLVRQALYGQHFFQHTLGAASGVGYNVDSFGHNANLPQILRKCGMNYYVFMRPHSTLENSEIPEGYFQWEGVDGSQVVAFHIFENYAVNEHWGMETIDEVRSYLQDSDVSSAMVFYGMGDHGGGPTRATLAAFTRMAAEPDMPKLVHATPREAFTALESEGRALPLFHGELQHHASGCYAAHSEIKGLNRRAEEALLAAERMATVAAELVGKTYPAAALASAWQDLLFNQFHDVMAGSSIREAYVDARDQLGRAIFSAEEVLNTAQQQLAAHIDTRGEGQAVLLFNPHTFPINGMYETENQYSGCLRAVDLWRAHLFTDNDLPLPLQHIKSTAASGGVDRFIFPVELPALGYRLYRLKTMDSQMPTVDGVKVGPTTLENTQLRVTVQPEGIMLEDLQTGRAVLRDPGLRALAMEDPSDTWGHDFFRYDEFAGEFTLNGVRVLEEGPLRGALRAEYTFGRSRLWLDIYLDQNRRAVELRGKLWWLERQRMLKMAFPVNVETDTATHEIPYAALVRPNNGEEEPIQQWIDIADAHAGLVVINDGRYSVSVVGQEIRQTILRSVPYAWSKCKMYPWAGENVDWQDNDWMQDQGISEFRLLLLPHDGDRDAVQAAQTARLFNRHPALMVESAHSGPLPTCDGYLRVEGEHVRVEVVKGAENGHGVILRAVETAGQTATVRLHIHGLPIPYDTSFTPWEIKTYRVRDGEIAEEDMIERENC